MRQLRDGKVENFPPQSELRCIMVEHALQGEDTSQTIIDFIASDKQLAGVPREKIAQQLREVGFDDERQQETTGGLSGGWKMKLELARAMLYNADLLLLDEPTNHVGTLPNNSDSFVNSLIVGPRVRSLARKVALRPEERNGPCYQSRLWVRSPYIVFDAVANRVRF